MYAVLEHVPVINILHGKVNCKIQYPSSVTANIVSSVRSSSGYHGLLEGSSTHFFKFFKFFRFERESESERT